MVVDDVDGRRRGKRGEGDEPASKYQIHPECGKCGITRDGSEPVSRDQILRHGQSLISLFS